ncbi:hypothetical protein JOM56_010098 [Amanita muscaria]
MRFAIICLMSFLLVPALGAPHRSNTPPPPYEELPPHHPTPPPSYRDTQGPLGQEGPPSFYLPPISSVISPPSRPPSRGDGGRRYSRRRR